MIDEVILQLKKDSQNRSLVTEAIRPLIRSGAVLALRSVRSGARNVRAGDFFWGAAKNACVSISGKPSPRRPRRYPLWGPIPRRSEQPPIFGIAGPKSFSLLKKFFQFFCVSLSRMLSGLI